MGDDRRDAIARIRDKLRDVPSRSGRSRSFGEQAHRFRLNPPLPERQASEFEARHGVALPRGYRAFLVELGDGGAGPYYGLLPLAHTLDAALHEAPDGHLASPCPLTPDMHRGDDWLERLGCSEEGCFRGTIPIIEQGCAFQSLLVVSGRARGRVVHVNLDLAGPPDFPADPDFLAYYERWLDEMALGYDLDWFGSKLPGDEAVLLAILGSPAETPERRGLAAWSLLKLPSVGPEAALALRSALGEEDAGLREAAAQAIGRLGIDSAATELVRATRDPEAKVRTAALISLASMKADGWDDEARRLLTDPDPEVVQSALNSLLFRGADRLRLEDVLPLLARGEVCELVDVSYYLTAAITAARPRGLGGWLGRLRRRLDATPPSGPLEQAILAALDDSAPEARIAAIRAMWRLRLHPLTWRLERIRETEVDGRVKEHLDAALADLRRRRWRILPGRRPLP